MGFNRKGNEIFSLKLQSKRFEKLKIVNAIGISLCTHQCSHTRRCLARARFEADDLFELNSLDFGRIVLRAVTTNLITNTMKVRTCDNLATMRFFTKFGKSPLRKLESRWLQEIHDISSSIYVVLQQIVVISQFSSLLCSLIATIQTPVANFPSLFFDS